MKISKLLQLWIYCFLFNGLIKWFDVKVWYKSILKEEMCTCDTSRDMIFRSGQLLQLTIHGSARNLVVDFLFMFVLQCHRLLQV